MSREEVDGFDLDMAALTALSVDRGQTDPGHALGKIQIQVLTLTLLLLVSDDV